MRVSVQVPPGTPFRQRVRIQISVVRFAVRYCLATPGRREDILRYLGQQPGVRVTLHSKARQVGRG